MRKDVMGYALGIIGYIITLIIIYETIWDIPWLVLGSGLYFLGIALAWSWKDWVGPIEYGILAEVIAFILGIYVLAQKNAWTVLTTTRWCPIPPCPSGFLVLGLIVIGSLVYYAISYFNEKQ